MNAKQKFPSWIAPIIGAILPIGMAMVGQYKQDHSILAVWEIDSDRLLLMVGLGFFGGIIIWVYDLAKSKINK